ncbi:TonB-dependent receptor plug domain-containing protein [Novosphingobium aerophilum]|uniref:TonB-dependent receptor plug domain-containing protein n=1 Tax=Novosphingobium TaxID=165696 RepID=UPI002D798FAD|nr:energy transducer TonB [Novosphingobium sp. RL4]WRT93988.1 energy transducer TonB [Novosphingobium sp. RL4]
MHLTLARALLAAAVAVPSIQAHAQDQSVGGAAEQQLPEVVADGERADESYVMGTGAEAGTTRITEKEIRARAPGSGDANQLLKALPTVQFRRDEYMATEEDIQDIRPSDISISGGRYYENLITLDGVDANARVDITQSNPQHFAEPTGASAQSLWVDTNLIGEITLRDSNVSAEYGRFTGGALDIKTRSPKKEFGFTSTVSYSSDALTHYKLSDGSRESLDGDLPEKPSFEKWRFGATVDLPVSSNVGLLLGYNRSRADVVYTRGANYGSTRYGQSSVSDNFLAKAEADLAGDLKLTGQFVYTPYESESSSASGIDNKVTSHGGGITSRLELAKSGTTNWSISASLSHSDTSRDASANNYSIPSWTENGGVCTGTNCTIGGFGDVDQWQNNYALTGRWSAPVGPGRLAIGFDYQRIEAMRSRPADNYAYSRGTAQSAAATIACGDANSLTCVAGEYALTQYSLYAAYRARVNLDSVAGWAEYSADLGDFSLRAGLRYDYESFLGNHNFSPRLSATYALPWDGWSFTLGANRYYGRSMLAYALREQYPDNFVYRRNGTTSGGITTYTDGDWYLYSTSHSASYSDGDKKTPYSDELSAALSARVLGGSLRVKGIYREGNDEFVRSAETLTTTLANGNTTTYTNYFVTNEGYSKYRGLSFEWTRTFGKHSFAFNTNFSKTTSSNDTYLVDSDDLVENPFVAFQGKVVTLADIVSLTQRDDMAVPFMANMTWTVLWLSDRITTNVNVRYTDKFKRIEDTGRSETIDGTAYDLYDYVKYPRSIDVNLNAQAELIRSSYGVLTADLRVANLFDRIPSPNSTATSQPYQYGRSFWVGLNYRF